MKKWGDASDLTLDYSFNPSDNISLSLGMTSYNYIFAKDFSFGDNTSQEFYIAVGFSKVIFSPTVTIFFDINLGDGFYVQLAGEHSIKMSDKLTLDLSAQIGYNGKQWIDKSGLSDLVLGVSVPLKVGKISISPFVDVAFIFMDELNSNNTEFWFGATISL